MKFIPIRVLKNISVLASLCAITGPALAYQPGTYNCKNLPGLPANVYEIRNLTIDGVEIPHVSNTRYHWTTANDGSQIVSESQIKGVAGYIRLSDGTENLLLGALRLEFKDNEFLNCQKP